jgi:hypothetical protein
MDSLAQLLGSSTRANIIEALATSGKPLSPYRVSKMFNMNTAKVYIEMKRLVDLGLVSCGQGSRGLEYTLQDENLRGLAIKLAPRTIPFDIWNSKESKARRLRNGLIKTPKFSLEKRAKKLQFRKPSRIPGELDSLAKLARRRFETRYRRIGEREYALI